MELCAEIEKHSFPRTAQTPKNIQNRLMRMQMVQPTLSSAHLRSKKLARVMSVTSREQESGLLIKNNILLDTRNLIWFFQAHLKLLTRSLCRDVEP